MIGAIAPGLAIAALGGGISLVTYLRWFAAGADIKPGLMPLAVGVLLLLLGSAIAYTDAKARHEARAPSIQDKEVEEDGRPWKALFVVLGALIGFALLIDPLGVIGAVGLVSLCCALLMPFRRIGWAVLSSACLIGFIVLVFVFGLGLPIPVWPEF